MKNSGEIKRMIRKHFGWVDVRRSIGGEWFCKSGKNPGNKFRSQWARKPLWNSDDELVRSLRDKGEKI